MSWNKYRNADAAKQANDAAKAANVGRFFKIRDGESIDLVFVSEPVHVLRAFVRGSGVAYSEGMAPLLKKDDKPSDAWVVGVYRPEVGRHQVWEMNLAAYLKRAELEDADVLWGKVVRVKRTDASTSRGGRRAEYTMTPLQDIAPEACAMDDAIDPVEYVEKMHARAEEILAATAQPKKAGW